MGDVGHEDPSIGHGEDARRATVGHLDRLPVQHGPAARVEDHQLRTVRALGRVLQPGHERAGGVGDHPVAGSTREPFHAVGPNPSGEGAADSFDRLAVGEPDPPVDRRERRAVVGEGHGKEVETGVDHTGAEVQGLALAVGDRAGPGRPGQRVTIGTVHGDCPVVAPVHDQGSHPHRDRHGERGCGRRDPVPAPDPSFSPSHDRERVEGRGLHRVGAACQQVLQVEAHGATAWSSGGNSARSGPMRARSFLQPRGCAALHGADRAPHRLRRVCLREVHVVAQHDRRPLPRR